MNVNKNLRPTIERMQHIYDMLLRPEGYYYEEARGNRIRIKYYKPDPDYVTEIAYVPGCGTMTTTIPLSSAIANALKAFDDRAQACKEKMKNVSRETFDM